MSHPVRVGIIGTGFGATVHLPAFRATPGFSVRGIASRDDNKTRGLLAGDPSLAVFSRWEDMVSASDIDAIIIASPPATHAEMALRAIRNGKHLLCEKPFALTVAEAREMYAAAQGAETVAVVNFEFRLHPAFELLKEAYERGDVGRVRGVSMKWMSRSWSDPQRPWVWQCDKGQGGGVLGALGVHMFDHIEWLFGPVTGVSAAARVTIPRRTDEAGILRAVTSYDHCSLRFTLSAGFEVVCELSNVSDDGTGHSIEITGDRGSIGTVNASERDYVQGFSFWKEGEGDRKIQPVPFGSAASDGRIILMQRMAGAFLDAIANGKTDLPSFRAGLRTQLILDAIERSIQCDAWVDIPEV